ncbi:putative Type III secretion system chaperone [Gammaproteobacteria bacterium]
MNRDQANQVVQQLGKILGMDIALDASGTGVFVVDGKTLLSLGFDALMERLVLMSVLDDVDAGDTEMRAMLRANFLWRGTGGATFAMPAEGDAVALLYPLPADVTAIQLQDILTDFLEMIESWTQNFRQMAEARDDLSRNSRQLPQTSYDFVIRG